MKASNRSQVDPFIVMDVMEAARQAEDAGRHIIHMEVGQPGTPAPARARDALASALQSDAMGYTVALGLPALRQRIARLYGDWYDVDLDPGRVVVTAGSSAGFILSFTALFDAGQRVGIGCPGYPSYRQILKSLSLQPVDIPTDATTRFQPPLADLDRADLDGLLIASPGNPTGTMLDRAGMETYVTWAADAGVSFISDEIYHGIEYDAKAVTALEVSDQAYVINSFSKYHSMTGWRVGWMVVPQDHVRGIERLAQNMFICPSHAGQIAALAAMDAGAELDANLAVYRRNRDLMIDGLAQAGFTQLAPPDGAFYVYADISAFHDDSRVFAADVLDKVGVAITPGVDFDPDRGHHWVRFSYARSTEDITEGLARLTRYMATRSVEEKT